MPESKTPQKLVIPTWLRYIFIALGLCLGGMMLWSIKPIIIYVIISSIVSLIGQPLSGWLCRISYKGYHMPRAVGAGVTLIFIWSVFFVSISTFIPVVVEQTNELSKVNSDDFFSNIHGPLKQLETTINAMKVNSEPFTVKAYVQERLLPLMNVSQISTIFQSTTSILGDVFVAFFAISFISYFLIKDEGLILNFILLLVPDSYAAKVDHVMKSARRLLSRYFVGIIMEVSLVMILNGVGLTVIGLKFNHVMVMALFTGLLNVIPYIGPLIGIFFCMIVGWIINFQLPLYPDLLSLLALMLTVLVITQIIDNILLQPLIYSNSVNAHPLEIFLVIMIASHLTGIGGMVLAIPAYTVLRVFAKEFFNNYRIVKKLTEKI